MLLILFLDLDFCERVGVGAGLFFLYGKPLDQCGGYLNFYGMRYWGFDFADKLGCGCLAHKFPGDIDGGEGGVDDSAFGNVVESCNGDVLGDFEAAELQGFHGSDGDEIIVCEVGSGKWGSAVYDLQHIGECSLNRWGELMNNGFCGGHSMFADCTVKTVGSFTEVCDLVGGAKVSWLAAAAVNKITGGQVSPLGIVAQYTAAVSRIEIGIQKNYRN